MASVKMSGSVVVSWCSLFQIGRCQTQSTVLEDKNRIVPSILHAFVCVVLRSFAATVLLHGYYCASTEHVLKPHEMSYSA